MVTKIKGAFLGIYATMSKKGEKYLKMQILQDRASDVEGTVHSIYDIEVPARGKVQGIKKGDVVEYDIEIQERSYEGRTWTSYKLCA